MTDFNELWLADPADVAYPLEPTTRLIDLNEGERGDCEGLFILEGSINFGGDTLESIYLGSYGHDGDLLGASRHANKALTFRLAYEGKDVTEALDTVRDLATALDRRGVVGWQLRGSTEVLYFDHYNSQFPELLRGQTDALHKIADLLMDPDGLPIEIICHPWPRSAPMDAVTATLTNGVLARDILVPNPGNRHSEVRITVTPEEDAANSLGMLRYGIKNEGDLAEFRTLYGLLGSDATVTPSSKYKDTTVEAVSGASGGDAAVSDFDTEESLFGRLRFDTLEPTDPTAIEGVYRAYLRLVPDGGTTQGVFDVQLRYGFSEDTVAMEVNDKVKLDFRDVDATPEWVEIDMGLVFVGKGAAQLVFEVWAARRSGDTGLAFDMLQLVPADEHLTAVAVPGFRYGSWGRTRYDAEDLAGTGVLVRDTYRLNENGEIGRTVPAVGLELPAGVYRATVDVAVREPTDGEVVVAKFQVLDSTTVDGSGFPTTVRKSTKIRNRAGHRWTRRKRTIEFRVSSAEETAEKKFLFRVIQDAATAEGRKVLIHEIKVHYLAAITDTRPLVIDSYERDAYVRAGSAALFPAIHENDLPLAPPGDSVWVVGFGDLPTDAGYQEIDEREVLARSRLARSCEVSIVVIPRYSH